MTGKIDHVLLFEFSVVPFSCHASNFLNYNIDIIGGEVLFVAGSQQFQTGSD